MAGNSGEPTGRASYDLSRRPGLRYEATIIGDAAMLERCADLNLDLLPVARHRADGSNAVEAALTPNQVHPLLERGVTIVLRGIIDPEFPRDRIMSVDEVTATVMELAELRERGEQ